MEQRRRGLHAALFSTWILLAALVIRTGTRGGTAGFGINVTPWQYALTQFEAQNSCSGCAAARTVWGGKANLDEFIVDSPGAGVKIEGVALRLYDAASQQWRIYWANSKRGIVDPPVVGRFSNGRGEFFGMDELDGRAILVRYVWSNITPNSAHFEQSFSVDGGKSWETNWISDVTRLGE